jgi:dienelactone hydrolase
MVSNFPSDPPIASRNLSYFDDDQPLTGVLYWNPAAPAPEPGILLIHGGSGLDQHARDQARRYAQHGYSVLACDMYGDETTGDRDRIMACLNEFTEDPALMVRRADAGLTAFSDCPEAGAVFAAIGFCFGGMAALALARAGTKLQRVVSIHGSLATVQPAESGMVTAHILVCHGAADPFITMKDVVAFSEEMSRADADWQLNLYGRAMHGFTHDRAAAGETPGVAFDPAADRRSFAATLAFLDGGPA